MATTDTARPETGTPRGSTEPGPPVVLAPTGPSLADFRAGRSDLDRVPDLLAFAIATEQDYSQAPDGVERARRDADAALGDYSVRYLHNTVDQIRQEAVTAHLGGFRQPPGFLRLVAANLVALAIGGAVAGWLWTRPEVRAALHGLFGS